MLISTITSTIAIALALIIIALAYILSARSHNDRENTTPFECGFDPSSKARIPFSTRFFLLAVIFLVFDIEIILLMPAPLILSLIASTKLVINSFAFLIVLLLGTLHEWREGSLSWTN